MGARQIATGTAAALCFLALATALAWPVVTADRDPMEWTDVEVLVEPLPAVDVIDEEGLIDHQQREVALMSGDVNDRRWILAVSSDPETFCYTFHVVPGPEQQGSGCSEMSPGGGGSMFAPAVPQNALGRATFVAVLPETVDRLGLRFTDDVDGDIHLVRAPTSFRYRFAFLVAFLPAETDIVEARALDADGNDVPLTRIEDQVNAY
ncbi:MAG: hypothetical protein ACRDKT_09530 [Actinomycetota bacterium]